MILSSVWTCSLLFYWQTKSFEFINTIYIIEELDYGAFRNLDFPVSSKKHEAIGEAGVA